MKILAFSGAHGTGKSQVNQMVCEELINRGFKVCIMNSISQRAWRKYYELVYPGESHNNWQSLPPEDHNTYQLFAAGLAILDLERTQYKNLDYVLLDRSIYDVYAYSAFKIDVEERTKILLKNLFQSSFGLIDHTFFFSPEVDSPPDEKADRATYDKFDIDKSFHEVIKDYNFKVNQFIITPRGELEDKAKYILEEILHV